MPMPSKEEVLEWISENPTLTSKRDIAKAFGIKGAARIDLKRLLKELEAEGHLQKRRKTYRDPDKPAACQQCCKSSDADKDGDLFARPLEWHGEGRRAQNVLVTAARVRSRRWAQADRILGRLTEVSERETTAMRLA